MLTKRVPILPVFVFSRFRRYSLPLFVKDPTHTLLMQRYDALVLGGGGMKGVASLGSMAYLKERGMLNDIHMFVGTSVGAIIACVLAQNMDPTIAFREHVLPMKIASDVSLSYLTQKFGLDSGKGIDVFFARLVPESMTFESLFNTTGNTLVICATNLNTYAPEYFDRFTTPTMPIRLALRMSCSVPMLFTSVPYKGSLYVDGGIADNFPVAYADEQGYTKILGVKFVCTPKARGYIWTLDSVLGSILEASVNTKRFPKSVRAIELRPNLENPFNFRITKHEKQRLFNDGYAQTAIYFKKNL